MAKVQFLEQGAYAVLWLPNWFHFDERMVRMLWLGSFGILDRVWTENAKQGKSMVFSV